MDDQVIAMNSENARKLKIGRWLFSILLLWPVIVILGDAIALANNSQSLFRDYATYFGSPILGAILIGIALGHYPASRQFLKVFIIVTFVVTILCGGFYYCATLASNGNLLRTMVDFYARYSHAEPPISTPALLKNLIIYMTISPMRGLRMEYLIGLTYPAMTGPYFLLLLFITPPFLAIPVFWLWVVLSVLYVVLPRGAWARMNAAMVQGLRVVLHQH